MKCRCGQDMECCLAVDDPNMGYAFNVYHCLGCLVLAKENVWEREGVLWIDVDNSTSEELGGSQP